MAQAQEQKALKKSQFQNLKELADHASATNRMFDSAMNASSSFNIIQESAIKGEKDNSKKAYYKEFKKVVESADVILEVLDARDPLGCRTRQIEEMILNSGLNKRIILVLNKIGIFTIFLLIFFSRFSS
jgi:nuclear GTP-binding protein